MTLPRLTCPRCGESEYFTRLVVARDRLHYAGDNEHGPSYAMEIDEDIDFVGLGPIECGTCGAVVAGAAAAEPFGNLATLAEAVDELKRQELAAIQFRLEVERRLQEAGFRLKGGGQG